jgi:23S rRNA (cytosine1962-C5)-methyltransferase
MQVVTANPRHPPPKGAQRAVTRWSLVSRHGNRALVSLEPETGRTHQLRVQLAAMGTPIEGDPLYGKPSAAPRLMLHALSLTLPHPTTGRPVTFTAEAPKELLAWAKGEADPRSLDERLLAAADQRWDLARDPDTTAFRLAHDGDGFASTPIDVYGEWALVHCYDAALDDALTGALLVGGMRGVYVKHRPKQGNTVVDTRKESLAPKHAVSGEDAPESMTVREHGLRYEVHLGDGLSTGIFLDQRENRRRVRELAKGLRVLNLFAYTGAFTVAAAAGGAAQTVTVDVSASVIAWAQRNLELNELSGARHSFVTSDVFPWMEAAKARKQVFDLVLLDPPSYATTRDSRFSAASDYPKLAALAMSLVAPGGRLLACTNHHEIARMKFRRWLYESARAVGREVTQAKDLPTPIDFPPPADGHAHLKSVLVTLK